MPAALSPAQALAAAIRDRLAVGDAVTLPALGMLARLHEPARVDVDSDGRRVLLPPRVTVHFEASP
jgi:hypothetical protein